jgi:deoxyadenosine/deoxycytidine kinase
MNKKKLTNFNEDEDLDFNEDEDLEYSDNAVDYTKDLHIKYSDYLEFKATLFLHIEQKRLDDMKSIFDDVKRGRNDLSKEAKIDCFSFSLSGSLIKYKRERGLDGQFLIPKANVPQVDKEFIESILQIWQTELNYLEILPNKFVVIENNFRDFHKRILRKQSKFEGELNETLKNLGNEKHAWDQFIEFEKGPNGMNDYLYFFKEETPELFKDLHFQHLKEAKEYFCNESEIQIRIKKITKNIKFLKRIIEINFINDIYK